MEAIVLDQNSPIGHLVGEPVRVPGDCTLGEVARRMRDEEVSSVLVGPGGAIATERDLAWALACGLGPEDWVVEVASNQPVRVPATTPVIGPALWFEALRMAVTSPPETWLG